MRTDTPPTVYLKDYSPPSHFIPEVDMHIDIQNDFTLVRSRLTIERNAAANSTTKELRLNGEHLELVSIHIDGQTLAASDYSVDETFLTLLRPPERFVLETVCRIYPHKNLAYEGLYKSGSMFCTQCEAEGFRRITYFLDRPDVMSTYKVTLEADQKSCPILLSNGNRISAQTLSQGRHQAVWHDPFKKPCYLFALVAGDLGVLKDSFRTRSGRDVQLEVYTQHGLEQRCRHAMDSLINAMRWDEEVFGLEYDLDLYMIVAAKEFNAGAMENKGLNIFNSSYVLADPQTATDADYDGIEAVIGHEYFHNWTGNRVTCRDWFQLSLKEGLTVFRDQQFSMDMLSPGVKRIEDVVRLRTLQFNEDAGPMAHPVRPASYISINNFYTVTVYEKGAELIRMMHTLIGAEKFRKGMDKYFELYDGQAVTTEDFVHAMELASGADLTQFKNWYEQAGTPVLNVKNSYDTEKQELRLTLSQTCPPTPGQTSKKAFHIPIRMGLLDKTGREIPLAPEHTLLQLREQEQTFVIPGIAEKPVISFLRGFTAPVKLQFEQSVDELEFLLAHDKDPYNRWESAQKLFIRNIQANVTRLQNKQQPQVPESLLTALRTLLKSNEPDLALIAYIFELPSETYLTQFFDTVDVEALWQARHHLATTIGRTLQEDFATVYHKLHQALKTPEGRHTDASRRHLKNTALHYLVLSQDEKYLNLALTQARDTQNMTDELAAVRTLGHTECPQRQQAFETFRTKWKDEFLVMIKWLNMQALSVTPHTLQRLRDISQGPHFDIQNPNNVYSLIGAFASLNMYCFHHVSGEGYRFVADHIIKIDSQNPQVAARVMNTFNQWRRFDETRQKLMREQIERILQTPNLSKNVFEIASKALT